MTITAIETQTTDINVRLIGSDGILGNITITRPSDPADAYNTLYDLLQHRSVKYREFDYGTHSELQIDVWDSNRNLFNRIKQTAKNI